MPYMNRGGAGCLGSDGAAGRWVGSTPPLKIKISWTVWRLRLQFQLAYSLLTSSVRTSQGNRVVQSLGSICSTTYHFARGEHRMSVESLIAMALLAWLLVSFVLMGLGIW